MSVPGRPCRCQGDRLGRLSQCGGHGAQCRGSRLSHQDGSLSARQGGRLSVRAARSVPRRLTHCLRGGVRLNASAESSVHGQKAECLLSDTEHLVAGAAS